jgi:hypothetical protein
VDLDEDGRTDMLSGSWPGEIYFFRRRPNGTFSAPETLKINGRPIQVGRATAVAAADWDGDGDVDLVIGNIDGALFWVENKGGKKLAFAPPQPLNAAGRAIKMNGGDAGPFFADWDGDGKLDLLVGSGSGEVQFFQNIGTPQKPELAAPVMLVSANKEPGPDGPARSCLRSKPAVADWNGDGLPDLLVGDFTSMNVGGKRTPHGWVWVYLRKNLVTTARVD